MERVASVIKKSNENVAGGLQSFASDVTSLTKDALDETVATAKELTDSIRNMPDAAKARALAMNEQIRNMPDDAKARLIKLNEDILRIANDPVAAAREAERRFRLKWGGRLAGAICAFVAGYVMMNTLIRFDTMGGGMSGNLIRLGWRLQRHDWEVLGVTAMMTAIFFLGIIVTTHVFSFGGWVTAVVPCVVLPACLVCSDIFTDQGEQSFTKLGNRRSHAAGCCTGLQHAAARACNMQLHGLATCCCTGLQHATSFTARHHTRQGSSARSSRSRSAA